MVWNWCKGSHNNALGSTVGLPLRFLRFSPYSASIFLLHLNSKLCVEREDTRVWRIAHSKDNYHIKKYGLKKTLCHF